MVLTYVLVSPPTRKGWRCAVDKLLHMNTHNLFMLFKYNYELIW